MPNSNITVENISEETIESLISDFEAHAQFTKDGHEFWYARDLQTLFEYGEWRNFLSTVDKARIACDRSRNSRNDHFVEVNKLIEVAKGAQREVADFMLSRYACYLIAQNADARKQPVAFAQSYFAIQTRRQELSDQAAAESAELSEDGKRVELRNQIKEHNKYLASAAKDAGVTDSKDFAIFQSNGYQGLYGKTVPEIRRYKGLPKSAQILDRMGSTELAANFFRVTQTEEKLRQEKILGKARANQVHFEVGRQVRDAMLKISGVAPEDLPVVENIKKAEKRLENDAPQGQLIVEPEVSSIRVSGTPKAVDLNRDLWKYSLLILATKDDGEITTSELIDELPKYITVPEESQEILTGRKDSKFSQLVRNLKSHKASKTNFIYQGYVEDVKGGFRITDKGRDFVIQEFS